MDIRKTAAIALGGEATGLAARHEAQILETRTSADALERHFTTALLDYQ